MSRDLRISKDLALPLDAGTRAIALIGLRGSGKTFTSAVLVEELHRAHVPVCIVDPVGAWWGLRSSADGKGAGLPIVIFGGDHADVPLEETSGELLANILIDERLSAVLDLSLLRKNARKRFMCDFAEHLYHRSRSSMHLVVDEAAMFAPQRVAGGDERLLGAMEDIVLRGRGRGLGITLITQRAALLNKSLLSQCEVLFAMRQSHNLDIKAIREWIDVQELDADAQAAVLRSLPKLATGTAYVWAPVLDLLERVAIRKRETFDSSKTPEPGQTRVEPRARAAVDLDAIRTKVAATIERAKADDPKALRARIAELERALAAKPKTAPAAPERIEVPVLADDVRAELREATEALNDARYDLRDVLANAIAIIDRAAKRVVPQSALASKVSPAPARPSRPAPSARPRRGAADALGSGERAILTVIAQTEDAGACGEMLTVMTGYKRSSRNTYLQRLRSAGLIEQRGERAHVTDAGREALGDAYEALPAPGPELQGYWLSRLPDGERALLSESIEAYPSAVDRESIGEAAGYKRSSRNTYLQRLIRRELVVAVDRSRVRASDHLFGGA